MICTVLSCVVSSVTTHTHTHPPNLVSSEKEDINQGGIFSTAMCGFKYFKQPRQHRGLRNCGFDENSKNCSHSKIPCGLKLVS